MNATLPCLALVAALLAAGGCKKKSENPRCRIFEQDLSKTEAGAFGAVKAAYEDAALVGECARAAGKSVDDFVTAHKLREKIEWIGVQLAPAAETVLGQASETAQRAKNEAQQAMDQSLNRIEQGIDEATKLVP